MLCSGRKSGVTGKYAYYNEIDPFNVIVEQKPVIKWMKNPCLYSKGMQIYGTTFKDGLNEAIICVMLVAREIRVHGGTPVLVYPNNLRVLADHLMKMLASPGECELAIV